jgi:hypothetical protein
MKHAVTWRGAPAQEITWRGWTVVVTAFSDIYDVEAYGADHTVVRFQAEPSVRPAMLAYWIMRQLRPYTPIRDLRTPYRKEPTDGQ